LADDSQDHRMRLEAGGHGVLPPEFRCGNQNSTRFSHVCQSRSYVLSRGQVEALRREKALDSVIRT
jgi:hypothetical protein